MSLINLKFGSPSHGWLQVALSGDGGEITLDVSDVPGDSLQMLATAAANVVDGRGESEVTWYLEPEEHRWSLRSTAQGLNLWVQDEGKSETCIAKGAVVEICAPIWRALRRLEVDPAWTTDLHVWSHPFPHREVESLGDELRRRRLLGRND